MLELRTAAKGRPVESTTPCPLMSGSLARRWRVLRAAVPLVLAASLGFAAPPPAQAAVMEYPISAPYAFGAPVTFQGSLWAAAAESAGLAPGSATPAQLLRASPEGNLRVLPMGTRVAQSGALASSESALWLPTLSQGGSAGALSRFSPTAETQDFSGVPSCGRVVSAEAEHDGTVWYLSDAGTLGCQPRAAVGRRQSTGDVMTWPLPDGTYPRDIALAPGGGVWVLAATKANELEVLRVSDQGDIAVYPSDSSPRPSATTTRADGGLPSRAIA